MRRRSHSDEVFIRYALYPESPGREDDQRLRWSSHAWWACQDLNLGPRPYQRASGCELPGISVGDLPVGCPLVAQAARRGGPAEGASQATGGGAAASVRISTRPSGRCVRAGRARRPASVLGDPLVAEVVRTRRGLRTQRNEGPLGPLVPRSAALLRAAQPLGVELHRGGAVRVDGDVGHEVVGEV